MGTYILALFPGAEEGEGGVPGNGGGGGESIWEQRRGRGECLSAEEGEGRVPRNEARVHSCYCKIS